MSLKGRLRATTDATGQALVLTVIFLVVVLGFAGLAIDVGHAYLVQRQLQSGVDAAALAGAQELPSEDDARDTALEYGPTGTANTVPGSTLDRETGISFKCVVAVGCSRRARSNAVSVTASSVVPTWFAKLLGQDSFTVNAKATACSPCTAKRFDIVVVLDRTGSMCDGGHGPCDSSADLDNAKDGIRQFLLALDPGLDYVGLGAFPPAIGTPAQNPPNGQSSTPSNVCSTPGPRNFGYGAWWPGWDGRGSLGSDSAVYTMASLSSDYSNLGSQLGCLKANGSTSYANALIEAKRELMRNGRGNVPDVIVFFTDGGANTTPTNVRLPNAPAPPVGPAEGLSQIDLTSYAPCPAGERAAEWAKAEGGGTQIYTIGYDLDGDNGGSCDAEATLRAMASDPNANFFDAKDGVDLGLVFESIATDLIKPAGQLIDDELS